MPQKTFYNTEDDLARDIVVLAGIVTDRRTRAEVGVSLAELSRLAASAGAEIKDELVITVRQVHPATLLSSGKIQELKALALMRGANAVIFDCEISPTHQRNLEAALDLRVLDRTTVILDIFAQRARSREGKIQVEAAQLRYQLPRLKGKRSNLSRTGGGIGTRGPGEQKLEVDRRRVEERVSHLDDQLKQLAHTREIQRRRRMRNAIPSVVLIGYTNAGKSTLLNTLTRAEVFAADELFATLDPTTRVLRLPGGFHASLTDTVGFIHQLPETLVAAFHATLEEITRADLLVHLIDSTSPTLDRELRATREVLEALDALHVPRLIAWNKVDQWKELDSADEAAAAMETGAPAATEEDTFGSADPDDADAPSGYADSAEIHGPGSEPADEASARTDGSAPAPLAPIAPPSSPPWFLYEPDLPSVRISARTGEGLPELLTAAERILTQGMIPVRLSIAMRRGDVIARVRDLARVTSLEWKARGAEIECAVPRAAWRTFQLEVLEQDGVSWKDEPAAS